MKKVFYSITTILLSAAVLSLSSCLKDPRYVDFSKVGTLIELPLAAANGIGNLTPEALTISSTPTPISLAINVAAPKPLTSALKVTLAVDTAAVTAYNKANGTAYVPLPTADYSISSLSVTVPANQNLAYLTVNINTSVVDPAGLFILALKIVDASGQKISNYNEILYGVQAKNQYDGVYSLKGVVHRDADATLGGPITPGQFYSLATASGTAVTFTQNWANGSGLAGIDPVTITVNPTTNAVTMSSSSNATLINIPGYNNHYDPSTKTFYISFEWNGTDPTHRSATDTLTYSGSR